MNDHDQKQLGKTLWNIADQLRAVQIQKPKTHKKGLMQQLFPQAGGSGHVKVRTGDTPRNHNHLSGAK